MIDLPAPALPCVVEPCTLRGAHLDGCPCDVDRHKPAHDGHCDGCQPRPREFELLCRSHHHRLVKALTTLDDVVQHLGTQLEPGGRTSDGGPVAGSREVPAPLDLDAVDAADEIFAVVSAWVMRAADEEAAATRRPLPAVLGPLVEEVLARCRRSSQRVYLDGRGRVEAVQPSRIVGGPLLDPAEAPAAMRVLCSWLRYRLAWLERQEWVSELVEELHTLRASALSRWGVAERGHRIVQIPCPGCGNVSLWWTPPYEAGAEVTVQCERDDCLHVIPESRWGWYASAIESARRIEQAEQRRAAMAAARAAERERAEARRREQQATAAAEPTDERTEQLDALARAINAAGVHLSPWQQRVAEAMLTTTPDQVRATLMQRRGAYAADRAAYARTADAVAFWYEAGQPDTRRTTIDELRERADAALAQRWFDPTTDDPAPAPPAAPLAEIVDGYDRDLPDGVLLLVHTDDGPAVRAAAQRRGPRWEAAVRVSPFAKPGQLLYINTRELAATPTRPLTFGGAL